MERLRFGGDAAAVTRSRCHFSRFSKKKINVRLLHATEHSGGGGSTAKEGGGGEDEGGGTKPRKFWDV